MDFLICSQECGKLEFMEIIFLDGKYNLWLLLKVALLGDTRFSVPDNYGKITNPSASRYIISVAPLPGIIFLLSIFI